MLSSVSSALTRHSILKVSIHDCLAPKSAVNVLDPAFPGLVVDYEFRKFEFFPNSTFAGEPRPESEEAWHQLMSKMAVRVTSEELAVHNQTSVSLPNGGYLAWLGVFHQLHCVKVLRHWAWREHYEHLVNMTSHEVAHHMVHVDHCVEALRSAAICRADTEALAVFKWLPDTPRPIFDTKRVEHRCVNWDSMMTSSYADRVVTMDEINSLKNPLLK